VPVPDERLTQLSETVKNANNIDTIPPQVPATVEFVDIAGLIAGAHKGEGLGNKFLAHIREVDAICHVVRVFENNDIVKEGAIDPESDLETIKTELLMADLATLENAEKKLKKEATKYKLSAYSKLKQSVSEGKLALNVELSEEEKKESRDFWLLTSKPFFVVLNVSEEQLSEIDSLEEEYAKRFKMQKDQIIAICAKVEEEVAQLDNVERKEYLLSLGQETSGLERLIKKAFSTLHLMSFLTAGVKEVRAWTVRVETKAPQAAAVIHTDFEKKFIKADVVSFSDFIECSGWKNSRDKGKVRSEGKEYIVKEGDVIEFKIGA